MDGTSSPSPSSLNEKRGRDVSKKPERFMWSNVCRSSKSSSPQHHLEQGRQLPLSKLFVSGTKHQEEERPQTKRLRMTEVKSVDFKLQENINRSNSQDKVPSSSHKSTSPAADQPVAPHSHPLVPSGISDLHSEMAPDPKQEANQFSTPASKSLGCWTFNLRKRKRLPARRSVPSHPLPCQGIHFADWEEVDRLSCHKTS
jgi:hypothetical protein